MDSEEAKYATETPCKTCLFEDSASDITPCYICDDGDVWVKRNGTEHCANCRYSDLNVNEGSCTICEDQDCWQETEDERDEHIRPEDDSPT